MVQITNKNIEIVKRFKNKLKDIGVDRLILFGSRARGTFHSESDFDLIIISNKFEGIPMHKRSFIYYANWKENYPVEIICYTPNEFEILKNKISIVSEALKEGIEI
jgi:hypothetical protein